MTATQRKALRDNIWSAPFERLRSKPLTNEQILQYRQERNAERKMLAERRRVEQQRILHARVLEQFPDDPFFKESIEIDKKYAGDASSTLIAQMELCIAEYNRDRAERLVLVDGAGI